MFRANNKIFSVLLLLVLVFYIAYHIINGKRGVLALIDIDKAIREKEGVLQQLESEKVQLEQKLALLDPEAPDLDYVDELKRSQAGVAGRDELVVILQAK